MRFSVTTRLGDSTALPLFVAPSRPKVVLCAAEDGGREQLSLQLHEAGYEVVSLSNPEQLQRCIERMNDDDCADAPPDLIIADQRIGLGPTGLELLSLLRQTDWGTPFILMSVFSDDMVEHHIATSLDATVVNKPVRPLELVRCAMEALAPYQL